MFRHSLLLKRIGPPAPNFYSLYPSGFLLNVVYACLTYQHKYISQRPHFVTLNIVEGARTPVQAQYFEWVWNDYLIF